MITLIADNEHRAQLRDVDVQLLGNGRVRLRGDFIANFKRTNGRHTSSKLLQAIGTGDEYSDAYDDMMRQALTALDNAALRE